MSWLITRKKRIQQQAQSDEIKRENERHKAILTAINAIAHEFEADHRRQATAEPERARRDRWTLVSLLATTGAAMLTLIASVCIAVFQHKDTMTVLRTTEAGWLVVLPQDIAIGEPDAAGNRPAYVNIWIRNRGKSPVTEVKNQIVVRAFPIQKFPSVFEYSGPSGGKMFGIINPDISQFDDPVLARANNPPFSVPLGGDTWQPAGTIKRISPAEYLALSDGKEVIVVYLRTFYLDAFKKKHWMQTCRVLMNARAIQEIQAACMEYNAIDPEGENYGNLR